MKKMHKFIFAHTVTVYSFIRLKVRFSFLLNDVLCPWREDRSYAPGFLATSKSLIEWCHGAKH